MSLLRSWWKTAQALAVKFSLAIWQVLGGKSQPWSGLALMAFLLSVFWPIRTFAVFANPQGVPHHRLV